RDRPVEPRIRTAPPRIVVGPGSANVTDPLAGSVAPCASSIRAMADGFDVVAVEIVDSHTQRAARREQFAGATIRTSDRDIPAGAALTAGAAAINRRSG